MQTLANASLTEAWGQINEAIDEWLHAVKFRPRAVQSEAKNAVLALIHDYEQNDPKRRKEIRKRVDEKLGGEYYLY